MTSESPPDVPAYLQDIEAMQAALRIMSQLDPIRNREMWRAGLGDLRLLLVKLRPERFR